MRPPLLPMRPHEPKGANISENRCAPAHNRGAKQSGPVWDRTSRGHVVAEAGSQGRTGDVGESAPKALESGVRQRTSGAAFA